MSVTIKSIDTIAEEDVYRRGGEYMTYTQLWINPDKRTCGVGQESGAPGKGTPAEEWHNLVLTYDIGGGKEFMSESQPAPDGDALEEFLESEEGQDLLDRICDGHDTRWDENNMVGVLDEDAQEAETELLRLITELPDNDIVTWTVSDWLGNCTPSDLGLRKLMSYRQIKKIAKDTEKFAGSENVYLSGDVYDYLVERQRELRD